MEFNVKLDRFEGPYTKLLDLILDRKLSITEISLVAVADDYINYIKSLDTENHADISQFILVASTLMLMKAKSLLPGIVYTDEEEKQVNALEHKLEIYRTLINTSNLVRKIYDKNILYERERINYKGGDIFVPDNRVTKEMLQSIILLTLSTFTIPKKILNVSVEQVLRIELVIENLLKRVSDAPAITLESLAGAATNFAEKKKLLIINFIALLELVRKGSISATQTTNTGDIYISSNN
ncbi:MAG: segregation/condensation protein A [Candidatus Nomurabacteria bacterium]|nr:segregation/condensation protein A [Candidatus Nomurabacteria bacterium]